MEQCTCTSTPDPNFLLLFDAELWYMRQCAAG